MANKTKEEVLIGERNFDSIFNYDAGTVRSRFLTELRDNQKIMGTRCPHCNYVYVPARSTCLKCFANLSDFVEVGKTGTLMTYTIVNSPQKYYPAEPPFIYGVIQLDGANTGLVHLVSGVDIQKVQIGMRLMAVFKKQRVGSLLDIKFFAPISGK